MKCNKIIRIWEPSSEGRSIGGGGDYSLIPCPPDRVRVPGEGARPTLPIDDTPDISLQFIIGDGRDYYLSPGEGAAPTDGRILLLKFIIGSLRYVFVCNCIHS
jgi:hypothetical protein